MNFAIRDVDLRFPRPRVRRSRTDSIVIHHLDAHWDVHRTHQFHNSLGWNGIGYNFHVAMDGTITLGRGMEFQGAHKLGFNNSAIGIGCEGRFHSVDRVMPDVQFNALVWLIRHLRERYGSIRILGHRDYNATACPGQFFPLDELRNLQFRTQEESDMSILSQEQFNKMAEVYFAEQRQRPESEWAREYWNQMVRRGLFDGNAPRGNLTREQAAAVFSRMLGVGVDVSAWAQEAWESATEMGITDGTNPAAPATREQVITFLYRLGLLDE